jgi:uncharacterized protein DUF4384
MPSRSPKTCLIAALVAGLFAPAVLATRVAAQKQGAPLWYSVTTVNRVKKPDRKPARPLVKTQKAALLTLQWHLIQRVDDDTQAEADSSKEFQSGDKLKVAVTTNQSGYLYIVNQRPNNDSVLLFPDLRINKGRNYVQKDKEYIVPSYCPGFKDPNDCWFKIAPPAGTDTMIVIFSRDRITTLPSQIAKPYSLIKRSLVDQLIASSQQKVQEMTGELTIPGKKAVRYATRVQNTNPKDNEELIATIELTHGG